MRAAAVRTSKGQPLSELTLASLPWMPHTQLAQTMQRLALNGPHDQVTWRKVISRAEVVAHTFTPKDTALMINAFAKARDACPSKEVGRFLRSFIREYMPPIIQTSRAIDLAQLAHGISVCHAYDRKTFEQLSHRMQTFNDMDSQQISLIANAFSREKHEDKKKGHPLLRKCCTRETPFAND